VFRSLIVVFEKEDYALKRALSPNFCLLIFANCPVGIRNSGKVSLRRGRIIRRARWPNDHEQREE
jgi:hypothetical protein